MRRRTEEREERRRAMRIWANGIYLITAQLKNARLEDLWKTSSSQRMGISGPQNSWLVYCIYSCFNLHPCQHPFPSFSPYLSPQFYPQIIPASSSRPCWADQIVSHEQAYANIINSQDLYSAQNFGWRGYFGPEHIQIQLCAFSL